MVNKSGNIRYGIPTFDMLLSLRILSKWYVFFLLLNYILL